MDSFRLVCFVLSFGLNIVSYVQGLDDEPVCTSRYDFESKLLRDSIKMDFEMSLLKEQYRKDIESLQATTKTALDRLEALSNELQNEQKSKLSTFEKIVSDTKNAIDEKMVSFEQSQDAKEKTLEDLYKLLEVKNDETLKKIENLAVKPPVNFVAKGITDSSPDANAVLVFPETVMNIGNAYDQTTGYFSVPVNGTYAFTVQLCTLKSLFVHIQMYADDLLVNNAMITDHEISVHDYSYYPCRTLNTYIYLSENTRVCVKTGSNTSPGTILKHDEYDRWTMFMGALMH